MCGIVGVGVVGRGPAAAPILDALRRLEYRGYDSAGIATLERGLLTRRRAVRKLKDLEHKLSCKPLAGPEVGVASTKAFICQLATLACLAIAAGRDRGARSTTRCRWRGRSPMFQAT
jgi:glucosamine 6-phosphate synthetase-like amidotransferase/phosphosugar isomerase protein